jgi:hypothetical protein
VIAAAVLEACKREGGAWFAGLDQRAQGEVVRTMTHAAFGDMVIDESLGRRR